jgi:hypothetical protein
MTVCAVSPRHLPSAARPPARCPRQMPFPSGASVGPAVGPARLPASARRLRYCSHFWEQKGSSLALSLSFSRLTCSLAFPCSFHRPPFSPFPLFLFSLLGTIKLRGTEHRAKGKRAQGQREWGCGERGEDLVDPVEDRGRQWGIFRLEFEGSGERVAVRICRVTRLRDLATFCKHSRRPRRPQSQLSQVARPA